MSTNPPEELPQMSSWDRFVATVKYFVGELNQEEEKVAFDMYRALLDEAVGRVIAKIETDRAGVIVQPGGGSELVQ